MTLRCDASFHADTATAGIAAVLMNDAGVLLQVWGDKVCAKDPMDAEIQAVSMGLERVVESNVEAGSIQLVSDNTSVVRALNGETTLKGILGQKVEIVRNLYSVYFCGPAKWESRDNNAVADALARSSYQCGEFSLAR